MIVTVQPGVAAGAAGLTLETHLDPGHALSDGPQALSEGEVADLLRTVVPRREPGVVRFERAAAVKEDR